MTEHELAELFLALESERVERKESASDLDRIRQAICALSNDLAQHRLPGVIFVGQRDDLSCAGLAIDDRLMQQLAGLRSEGKVLPFPTMSVRKVRLGGCEVVAIIVEPSDNPPARLDGRTWVRVGPRRAVATAEEERRLVEKRRWGNLPFDAHGVKGATMRDLDLARFELEYLPAAVAPDVLAQNQRTREQQLAALRLVTPDGLPTVTAILMLGIAPRQWLPGAYVQFLRIRGEKLTDAIEDQRELNGTLTDQLRQLDELLRIHVARPAVVGSALRQGFPSYPDTSLRQLTRNALLHRTYEGSNAPVRLTWYDDRVEIQSPGGPFGQVTRATFGQPGVADYRNPTLAEALKSMGFIERFGVGIPLARQALQANGNPDPEFLVEEGHVLVTVRARP